MRALRQASLQGDYDIQVQADSKVEQYHHCNENRIYVFLFWELRDLSPNFHIHVSVGDLYIPRIGPHISCSRIGRSIVRIVNRSQTHEFGNRDCGCACAIFWKYFFRIFGIGSLQCCQGITAILCLGIKSCTVSVLYMDVQAEKFLQNIVHWRCKTVKIALVLIPRQYHI